MPLFPPKPRGIVSVARAALPVRSSAPTRRSPSGKGAKSHNRCSCPSRRKQAGYSGVRSVDALVRALTGAQRGMNWKATKWLQAPPPKFLMSRTLAQTWSQFFEKQPPVKSPDGRREFELWRARRRACTLPWPQSEPAEHLVRHGGIERPTATANRPPVDDKAPFQRIIGHRWPLARAQGASTSDADVQVAPGTDSSAMPEAALGPESEHSAEGADSYART